MNEPQHPDVEKIIAEIRSSMDRVEAAVPDAVLQQENLEGDFRGNLAEANRRCAVGLSYRGLLRFLYRPLAPLIGEINAFHAAIVRTLNKLVRVIEGDEAGLTGQLIEKNQRRIDLLRQLGKRLDDYDSKRLDDRVRELEEKVRKLSEGKA